jgi:hypothetical protein
MSKTSAASICCFNFVKLTLSVEINQTLNKKIGKLTKLSRIVAFIWLQAADSASQFAFYT